MKTKLAQVVDYLGPDGWGTLQVGPVQTVNRDWWKVGFRVTGQSKHRLYDEEMLYAWVSVNSGEPERLIAIPWAKVFGVTAEGKPGLFFPESASAEIREQLTSIALAEDMLLSMGGNGLVFKTFTFGEEDVQKNLTEDVQKNLTKDHGKIAVSPRFSSIRAEVQ